jgi:hypothetical protein
MSTLPFPVIDGFILDTDQRCDLQFKALAVEQYHDLRRSKAFRSKAWCIPNDVTAFPIPARDSYEYQVYMKPGSAIWGYSFTGDSTAGGGISAPVGIDSFQVRETCTDVPLFSEFVTKRPEQPNFFGQAWAQQEFLSSLLIVPAPGLLHVEIATTCATPRQIQLILWGGEPA